MPTCGSNIMHCDLPIVFDTYKGCSFMCSYCYVKFRTRKLEQIKIAEGIEALSRFIKGLRTKEMAWCDWNIPLRWGSLSDPFQPLELDRRASYKRLQLFADTQYPFIFTTKSTIVARPEYLEILKQCNAIGQISIVSPKYKLLEPYAPSFQERLNMLPALSKVVKRLIIRCQPYLFEAKNDVLDTIPKYRNAGIYGIIMTMMAGKRKLPGTEKHGNRMEYDEDRTRSEFSQIREQCHKHGLKFFCVGVWDDPKSDSRTCCGCAGLKGFRANVSNARRHDNIVYTKKMDQVGTGDAFSDLWRSGGPYRRWCKSHSYKDVLSAIMRGDKIVDGFGKEFQL